MLSCCSHCVVSLLILRSLLLSQVDGDDSEEEDETMGNIDVEAAPALAISDDAPAAKSEKKNKSDD